MQRTILPHRYFSVADLLIILLIGTVIYSLMAMGRELGGGYHPVTEIDLSAEALPRYMLFSTARGFAAYFLSLGFTLIFGYLAAKSRSAERILIPVLDILQGLPVLGFLPGLILGLVAIFPNTNIGLELAAILLIFTSQAWNMVFSYYASIRTVPVDLKEAATVMNLGWFKRLVKLELPYSAVPLAWNSVLSMAGGWFFLTVCEAFRMGDHEFRLPGIGAYMAVAIAENNVPAMVRGVSAMALVILVMDFVIWRPILSWVNRFRASDSRVAATSDPLMLVVVRESRLIRWIRLAYRRYAFHRRAHQAPAVEALPIPGALARAKVKAKLRSAWYDARRKLMSSEVIRAAQLFIGGLIVGGMAWGAWHLVKVLLTLGGPAWVIILRNTLWTMLRVFLATALSTLWAVPVGIWIATSQRRTRIAQPIIQIVASFPAPMLYPLVIGGFFQLGINFDWGSMFLMMLGVQWYVLFNVLAGALRIPTELRDSLSLMKSSRWERWRTLYLPSVFPSLVTGWVNAAGGAWNASIVAEYVSYKGGILKTGGLGAMIFMSAERADFAVLAASLTMMVAVIIVLNRTLWASLYQMAENRFRMDI